MKRMVIVFSALIAMNAVIIYKNVFMGRTASPHTSTLVKQENGTDGK